MRILIVEYRDIKHPESGGAELVLFEVFGRIAQRGHRIDYLCSSHQELPDREEIDGINVIRRGNQLLFNFVVPKVYSRELKKNGYDLIVEGIDKLPFFLPLYEKRIPILAVVPHLFGKTVFEEVPFLFGSYVYLHELLIPFVYKNVYFSVPAESTKEDLVRRGIRADRIRVIHNGLNHTVHVSPREKPSTDHPIIVYLGRVKKYKGIDIGMRAVNRLREKYPDVEYQIIGSGDYLTELHKLATRLNFQDNASFMGFVSEEEKVQLLQKAHVLVYLSPKEGWGLSVVEANACGTVAVTSDSPGLRESVKDGETGFVVEHGDVEAVARKIDRLLTDRELYGTMRTNALMWARKFNWERDSEETYAYMTQILATPA